MKLLRIAMMAGGTALVVAAIWVITQPEAADRQEAVALPGVREVRDDPIHGICIVTASDGASSVRGVMHFHSKGTGVEVSGSIEGLSPGKYCFIVAEYGDLRNIEAGSAGDAFYRSDWPMPSDGTAVADAMVIESDQFGVAQFEQLNPALTIYGPESIIGRSCLLYKISAAASGTHIAAGVIGRANYKWSSAASTPVTAHDVMPLDNC